MARSYRRKASSKSTTELDENKVSEHFTLREVERSYIAIRRGIDNTAPEPVIENARALAINVLEKIRDHYGVPFSPSSWYRCEALERIVAQSGFLQWCEKHGRKIDQKAWAEYFSRKSHPKGEAADIEVPGVSNEDLYYYIKDNLEFDQLILECHTKGDPTSGWVHVSYRTAGNRNEAFSID